MIARAEPAEPEGAEAGQDPPLVGDGGGHDPVEGTQPGGGDDQEPVAPVVDVAHPAPAARDPGPRGVPHRRAHAEDPSGLPSWPGSTRLWTLNDPARPDKVDAPRGEGFGGRGRRLECRKVAGLVVC